MKIYTKKGDQGETSLYGGERVLKDHPRLEAYGSVDELNACVGWLRSLVLDQDVEELLERIQHVLFGISSDLAVPEDKKKKPLQSAKTRDQEVIMLEEAIDRWDEELTALKTFILPAGTEAAVRAHIFRTVIRRVERRLVGLGREIEIPKGILKYLNRLSDCAFVLARLLNKRAGISDMPWNKDVGGL